MKSGLFLILAGVSLASPAYAQAPPLACVSAPTSRCIVDIIDARAEAAIAAKEDVSGLALSFGATAGRLRGLDARKRLATIAGRLRIKGEYFSKLMEQLADDRSDWHPPLTRGDFRAALAATPLPGVSSHNLDAEALFGHVIDAAIAAGRIGDVLDFARATPPPPDDVLKIVLDRVRKCACADANEFARVEISEYEPTNIGRRIYSAALRGDRAAVRAEIAPFAPDLKARRAPAGAKTQAFLESLKAAFEAASLFPGLANNKAALLVIEELPAFVSTGSHFFVRDKFAKLLGSAILFGDAALVEKILARHVAGKEYFITLFASDGGLPGVDLDAARRLLPKLGPADRARAIQVIAEIMIKQKRATEAVAWLAATKTPPDNSIVQALASNTESRALAQVMAGRMSKEAREELQGAVDIVTANMKRTAEAEALVALAKRQPRQVLERGAALVEIDGMAREAMEIACKQREHGAMLLVEQAISAHVTHEEQLRNLLHALDCVDGFRRGAL